MTHGARRNKPQIDKTEADLEAEADRILRDAGSLREHGILAHPDSRGERHEWRVADETLDYLSRESDDRRSTRQKADVVIEDRGAFGKKRRVRSMDSSKTKED